MTYEISVLSFSALSNVRLSTYSISAPIGRPLANRVTLISISLIISPYILGLKAKIIS